jgi:chromosome segregation and condensation protein ScpB
VVKHVDAAELRVVIAAVLFVAADVVHVQNLARRSSLEAGSTRRRKGGEGRSNVRNSVW